MARPKHPRPDANQSQIVQGLLACGFIVHNVSPLGGDCLDLFVGGFDARNGDYRWVQVELKTADGELTEDERAYLVRYSYMPIIEARSVEDVLDWFGR